jgi:hypothetical protein
MEHQNAIEALNLEWDYAWFSELGQHLEQEGEVTFPGESAHVALVIYQALALGSAIRPEEDDSLAMCVRDPKQLHDLRPSQTLALITLVDYVHCQLTALLYSLTDGAGGFYTDVLSEPIRAHLEASNATTEAIGNLLPEPE